MNKLLTKIVGVALGATMAVGVGLAAAKGVDARMQRADAAESTVAWTATSGGLGTGIGTGTISTGSYQWSYERTLVSGSSYSGFTSSYIQLGKNGGVENLTLTTSNIPGTIKSVSVDCASYQGKHNVSMTVGSTTYLSSTAVPTWSNNSGGVKTGTGSASGTITISFTGGTRALYIKTLTVIYEVSGGPEVEMIEASLKDTSKVWKKGETFKTSDVSVYALYDDGETEETITDGVGVKFGASANLDSVTLAAGDNSIIVNYGGQTDTLTVYGKAPTSVDTVTGSTSLDAAGNSSVSAEMSYEVSYNNSDSDYAATFSCSTAGWSKTADDGEGTVTLTFESNGTFAFTLSANDDSTVYDEFTYTVTGIPSVEYELYESSIVAGDYVFMSDDGEYAYVMNNTVSSNRITNGDTTPTVVNDKISNPSAAFVWHIAKNGDYWTIQNTANSKYLAGTNTRNQAALIDDVTDLAKWTINYTNNEWVFHNYGRSIAASDSANAYLRQNGTSGWACYLSSTASAPALFKLPSSDPAISVSVTEGSTTLGVGESATLTATKLNGATGTIEWTGSANVSLSSSTGDSITVTGLTAGNATVTASLTGCEDVEVAFVIQNGSASSPYTVAEARSAIDEGGDLTNKYTSGIVAQVDSYSSEYKSITYWISDDGTTTNMLEVYSGKGLNGADFDSIDDVLVGASVTVKGTLKKYSSTYEYDKNNILISYAVLSVTSITGLEGSLSAHEGDLAWDLSPLTVKGTLSGSDSIVDITNYVNVSTESTPGAIGQTTIDVTVTPKSGSVSARTFEVDAEVVGYSGLVDNGQYRISATRDGVTYYLKENGTSSAPSAVTNFYEATIFTFTKVANNTYQVKQGENYLYCLSDNNGLRFGPTSDTWVIEEGETTKTGDFNMYSVTRTRYVSLYNASDFRSYTSPTASNRKENTDLQAFTAAQFSSEFLSTYTAGCIDEGGYDADGMKWDIAAAQFACLSAADQIVMQEATGDESGSVIEQAVARYDYIVTKYGTAVFTDFMTRTSGSNRINPINTANNTAAIIVVATISVISVSALGAYFLLRKKKEER